MSGLIWPDVMQAAVSADGQSHLRLDRQLELLVQPLDHMVVRSDAILGVARLRQINMCKVDGWQTLVTAPIDQPVDLAPWSDGLKWPAIPPR